MLFPFKIQTTLIRSYPLFLKGEILFQGIKMSRKILKHDMLFFILVIIFFLISGSINILTANGVQEQKEEIEITVAVFKGPSGMAATKLLGDNFQPGFNTKVNYIILGSPMEAVAKMTSGEVDAVFLPVNMAAKLYTKGPRFKLAAVSGLGSLYMVSTDNSIKNWTDLRGKTIYLTGKGATPDYLLRYLLLENGLDPTEDVKLDFSAQASGIQAKA